MGSQHGGPLLYEWLLKRPPKRHTLALLDRRSDLARTINVVSAILVNNNGVKHQSEIDSAKQSHLQFWQETHNFDVHSKVLISIWYFKETLIKDFKGKLLNSTSCLKVPAFALWCLVVSVTLGELICPSRVIQENLFYFMV